MRKTTDAETRAKIGAGVKAYHKLKRMRGARLELIKAMLREFPELRDEVGKFLDLLGGKSLD